MRITSNMTANNAVYNLQKAQTALSNSTESTATQQKVNQPSDDPTSTSTLLNLSDSLNATKQYSTNITKATTFLNVTNTALTGMSDTITQAKTLVASITNGSNSASDRQSAHDQLVSLKQQIIDYANTQSGDTYVFGGASSSTAPFSSASNTYNGDSTQSKVEVTTNSYQTVNITGDRLLKGTGSNPSYGSTDILKTFDNLIAAVGDSTTVSNATAIQQGANDLDAGAAQVNDAQVDVAARMKRLDAMSTMNTNNKTTLENAVSDIQTVDLATVGAQLSQQQAAYSAALSATAKISQLSLLNYL